MARAKKSVDLARLRETVEGIVGQMGIIDEFGKAADHIPGLAEVDTGHFGIAVVTSDGDVVTGGEAETAFPIQSISKVFALTMALRAEGDAVWERVGREPSGDPFNSIIDLERKEGIPRNPLINAGALVVCDILMGRERGHGGHANVRTFLEQLIGEKRLGREAAIVEDDGKTSGFQNRALAYLARGFGNFHHDVEAVMRDYAEQCAIALTCRQLALAGRSLMRDGRDGLGEDGRAHSQIARRVNAIMLTCGQYDGSGDFAYRVGLPAKSGVGGGILAIAPDVASIAVWSPGLDENGNSLLGTLALERLTEKMGWSIFG